MSKFPWSKDNPCKVLFVCLGNICRSPTAHGVFAAKVREAGLSELIEIDSCGTGDWHIGKAPDPRATAAAAGRGYDLTALRARQIHLDDFDEFDFILTMDKQNRRDLLALSRGSDSVQKVDLFLSYAQGVNECEVPDPYYGDESGFDHVLDLVENAACGLLKSIQSQLTSSGSP